MELKEYFDLESFMFSMIDDFKFILSPEQWSSAFLDFSKNEILTLLFISRLKKANISEIAEYINSPLNTVTGVVGRLEKKHLVERLRSEEDRRIVNIVFTQQGKELMDREMATIGGYFKEIYTQLTEDEKTAALSIFGKVIKTFKTKNNMNTEDASEKKIRRITIE
jgi:MarR family transcriptional regulator, organic hydroperoxide resistance regulator